ncbi:MAG: Tex family protein [Bernardetiaceae bacterium]
MQTHFQQIAKELAVNFSQVEHTAELLDEGATIPFLARYRKERTGGLDEVQIANIRDRLDELRQLDKRRQAVLKSIEEQGKLTPELAQKIQQVPTLALLEDLYLPYKPKRKTLATKAKEQGLQPLADLLQNQDQDLDIWQVAQQYIDTEKGVHTTEEALQGARHIIAESINENAEARAALRQIFEERAVVTAKVIPGKETQGEKYKDYFDFEEILSKIPSHRLLALRRGEKEEILSLQIIPDDEEYAIFTLQERFALNASEAAEQVRLAARDAYKRLLRPSLETETRLQSKAKADEEAVRVFAENLRQLLLAAPMGQKSVLAIDPAFRTGCKVVCLDAQGQLLFHTAVFPHPPQSQTAAAGKVILDLCKKYKPEAIAIGNGTASRETERFVKALSLPKSIAVVLVNESGASVYSASAVAREEFPDHDVTVRGAVSIGRRLQDPLAEIVKIDPKSIGVGQYQHDVNQRLLKQGLDDTVISCVNAVGVELNTASKELLSYVSGLGESLAKNIVEYRNTKGAFRTRKELLKVSRLGEKAFEQAAGFLRIRDAKNPLDTSAVHPESYPIVEQMASDLGCTVGDLMRRPDLRSRIDLRKYVSPSVGMPTLHDIMEELAKPGRDPREKFEPFAFAEGIETMEDLRIGMRLPGIVTNITKFGAFIDIGVHQDGLAHVSQLSDRFIKDPTEAVKVHQQVQVTVTDIDIPRKRISLSLKTNPFEEKVQKPKATPSKPNMDRSLDALKRRFGK